MIIACFYLGSLVNNREIHIIEHLQILKSVKKIY